MRDIFEINKIENAVYGALENEGIPSSLVRLCFKADLDERYVFATDEEIIIIIGFWKYEKEPVFVKKEAERIPLKGLVKFSVEEGVSSARLTVEEENGERRLIAYFTNTCKASAQIFAKYVSKLADGSFIGIDEADRPENCNCPKCGRKYPEGSGMVCPHCLKSGKQFVRMAKFFVRYKAYLILMIISFAFLTAAGIAAPYLSSGFFYEEVLKVGGTFYGKVLTVLGMVITVKLITLFATMVNNYVTSIIAAKVVYDLKVRIFSSIGRLSMSFFSNSQTGSLMSQVTNDSRTIYHFFCDILPFFFIHIVQVVSLAVLMFMLSPVLAVASLITVPIYFIILKFTFSADRRYHNRSFSAVKSVNSFVSDFLTGVRVVKAFSKEKEERERFGVLNALQTEADKQGSEFRNLTSPIASFVLYLGNVITLFVGGYMCIKGTISYGTLLTFTAYMNLVYEPMRFFTTMSSSASGCSAALSRLFQIDDARSEIVEKENAEALQDVKGDIEFRNVSFSYNRSRRVVDNVSFKVKSGETLGIVGRTGAGKTTLANLIMRLYAPDSGKILIDGKDIADVTLKSIYENAAIVSQETHIFTGTILENIRYACEDASLEEVINAAKISGAHDFIIKLPDAYMERVGLGYKELSGGEKQRISIARAILKKPKILILDEATAAMDTKTEQKISEALSLLTEDKTTIIIAHRLSTLKEADHLIVIDDGRVAERGTHQSLLNDKGIYHKLYTLQTQALKRAGVLK